MIMKIKQVLSFGLLSLTLLGAVAPSVMATSDIVYANENIVRELDPVIVNGNRLFVVDGRVFELPADSEYPTPEEIESLQMERGRWSAAVKTLRIVWNKIPANVRGYIAKYIGVETFISTLEHYTGWIETGIYNICISYGMPDWMANVVTKTIMLFIF